MEEVYPVTDVYFLSLTAVWVPPAVSVRKYIPVTECIFPNELVENLPRSQQSKFNLLEKLSNEKNWSDLFVQRQVGLHLLWLDVKCVEGRKEEKGEEIKGKAIRPFGVEEKSEVLEEVRKV